MSENLYQDLILDHYRNPRNRGTLKNATHSFAMDNTTCGDNVRIDLTVRNSRVATARFSGEGCAISQAAASLLMQHAEGKTIAALKKMSKDDMLSLLGGAMLGPARLRCALLALEVLQKALDAERTHKK